MKTLPWKDRTRADVIVFHSLDDNRAYVYLRDVLNLGTTSVAENFPSRTRLLGDFHRG